MKDVMDDYCVIFEILKFGGQQHQGTDSHLSPLSSAALHT